MATIVTVVQPAVPSDFLVRTDGHVSPSYPSQNSQVLHDATRPRELLGFSRSIFIGVLHTERKVALAT